MTDKTRRNRRFLAALSILAFCFGVASDASARGGSRGARGSHQAEQDVIDEIDVAGRTITIAGETYLVSESTRLFDERGRRMRLRELRAGEGEDEGDMVEFTVRRAGEGKHREVRKLTVLPGDFE